MTSHSLPSQELDVIAAQLNNLAAGGGSRDTRPLPEPPEDDDSDEDSAPAHDGTLLASEPPRPL